MRVIVTVDLNFIVCVCVCIYVSVILYVCMCVCGDTVITVQLYILSVINVMCLLLLLVSIILCTFIMTKFDTIKKAMQCLRFLHDCVT